MVFFVEMTNSFLLYIQLDYASSLLMFFVFFKNHNIINRARFIMTDRCKTQGQLDKLFVYCKIINQGCLHLWIIIYFKNVMGFFFTIIFWLFCRLYERNPSLYSELCKTLEICCNFHFHEWKIIFSFGNIVILNSGIIVFFFFPKLRHHLTKS